MLKRELEPEVMDDVAEAEAYDQMDHSAVNAKFVEDLLAGGPVGQEVIDLGTGTAQIPIVLCQRVPDCRVLASDAAVNMLELARLNIAMAGMEQRIQLHHGDSKHLELPDDSCDALISNSLIHHLADPLPALRSMQRLVRPGGRLFVRDLLRPDDHEAVEALVSTYAAQETDECQQLLRQSLLAALSLEEVRELILSLGFPADTVSATSDRHWTWNAVRS